jgi:glucose-6-phosphate isomerase
MKLTLFGPDVYMDEQTYRLTFEEGMIPESSNSKYFAQIKNLAYDSNGTADDTLCYTFYQNLIREKDRALFATRQYTNGITLLMPGLTGGECRKNSGHYHDYVEGHSNTFMEAYEVLTGEAVFLLQESHNFEKPEKLKVERLIAVHASAGDKVIVPPFCAHCVSNVGEGPMAFGNLAVPCPLRYEPIQEKHGFGVYILKEADGILRYVSNPAYHDLPEVQECRAKEAPDLGVFKARSLYESFVKEPKLFEFLYEPEKYEKRVWSLLD